jgi:hypothetical protein
MRNSKGVMAAAIAVTAAALGLILRSQGGMPPGEDRALHEEVGRALARESLGLLGPGGHLVLFARDTSDFPQDAADIARRSFEKEAEGVGHPVSATRLIADDPLRLVKVPDGDFFEVLRRAKAGDVVASFMGPPLLSDEQRAMLGEPRARIVAFCSGSMPAVLDLRRLAEQHLLHGAVLSRTPARDPGGKAGREAFEALYVRADAAALLRGETGGGAR